MTEIVCLQCNLQSPENALYCQQCGQPLRCRDCRAELLPKARACTQCGKPIPERSINEQLNLGKRIVPPGYNRLKLHETPDIRDLDLIVSNEAIEHIGDLLSSLIGNRPKGQSGSTVDHRSQKQSDLVEVPSEMPAPPPLLPAASLGTAISKDSSNDAIWEIFRRQDGEGIKQDMYKLKAASKKDYTIRLVYLYLYAKLQLSEKTVPRVEVYTILDSVGLKDGNTANNLSQATGISSDENEALWLNRDGREQVQQYIADVFNNELTDNWYPSLDARPGSNRIKKPGKKNSEQHRSVDADVAGWVSHKATKALANVIPHGTVVNLSILDQALLGLYGISKAGNEHEIPIALIVKYLYDAFKVQVSSQTLSNTFYRAREDKTPFVNFRDRYGYRITPSGREHIEELLNLKQLHLATADVNAESNGAIQQ